MSLKVTFGWFPQSTPGHRELKMLESLASSCRLRRICRMFFMKIACFNRLKLFIGTIEPIWVCLKSITCKMKELHFPF